MKRIKPGDLFRIPLSDEGYAIGHYVYWDQHNGPFIQVFDHIAPKGELDIDEVRNRKYLFPPVITGLMAAIKKGVWEIVGYEPVRGFVYPNFISAFWDQRTGEVINWFLYNGSSYTKLGPVLPLEYKILEVLVVWSPYDIAYRVETGNIPFPYGEMIKNNRFTPIALGNDGN